MIILNYNIILVVLFFSLCTFVDSGNIIEDIFSAIGDTYRHFRNEYFSKCTGKYFKRDLQDLQRNLNKYLFGQPLVSQIVLSALEGHLKKKDPSKPLALSFHGLPGCGKNYVADFIVKSLFLQEHESRNVHLFVAKIHFPLERYVDDYQEELIHKIKSSINVCQHSIFIFDEVDKYPPGVLNAVKPFLDYKVNIDGLNYRHAVFIFLSNTGSNAIVERTMELWRNGKRREDFELRDFEKLLTVESFNEEGGFYRSDMIDSHLIDNYVPFLPLEESHVRMCIAVELKKLHMGYNPQIADEIISDMQFGPEPENLFSVAGCKRVSQLVSVAVMKLRWKTEL